MQGAIVSKSRNRTRRPNLEYPAHVVPIEVDDPYALEPGGKRVSMRSTRNDPLAMLHVRKQIDEAQYQGGRAFQSDWEKAERGPRAIDPSKEAVDGGILPEPITEGQRKAARRLNRAMGGLGAQGSALTLAVLIEGQSCAQVARARLLTGERWERYFAIRFRECLDCLALVYGFANGKKAERKG